MTVVVLYRELWSFSLTHHQGRIGTNMTMVVLCRQLWSFSLTTWVRDRDKYDSGGSLQRIVVFFTHPPPGEDRDKHDNGGSLQTIMVFFSHHLGKG